jgi:hypothetical protein
MQPAEDSIRLTSKNIEAVRPFAPAGHLEDGPAIAGCASTLRTIERTVERRTGGVGPLVRALRPGAVALALLSSGVASRPAVAEESAHSAAAEKAVSSVKKKLKHRGFRPRELGLLASLVLCPWAASHIAHGQPDPDKGAPPPKKPVNGGSREAVNPR